MSALGSIFESVDVIAFQKGSLPSELERECLSKRHIIYEIDEHFHFTGWKLPK